MKKTMLFFFIGCIWTFTIPAVAQTKVDKYCEIISTKRLGFGVNIKLDYGEIDSLFSFRDVKIKQDMKKVMTFRTIPDALNYLSGLGWKLVTVTYMKEGYGNYTHFFFKRSFDEEELAGH